MTATEILSQLETMGTDTYKKVMLKHGVKEPFYGVKIEELKKIMKKVKNGHELSLELYNSGIYDAMYLAGLIAEPEKMTAKDLQQWAKKANCPSLREYTVAWVASESKHGLKKALEWIDSADEAFASIGWSTLSSIVAITDDKDLDIASVKDLLKRVKANIHNSPNRVVYTMNGFVIGVGVHVKELSELAKKTAEEIGKVVVDMGGTACKVPFAPDYIDKAAGKNAIGKKRKSARCL